MSYKCTKFHIFGGSGKKSVQHPFQEITGLWAITIPNLVVLKRWEHRPKNLPDSHIKNSTLLKIAVVSAPIFGQGGHKSVNHNFRELIIVLYQISGFEVNWNYISNMELGVEYGTEYGTGGTLMSNIAPKGNNVSIHA